MFSSRLLKKTNVAFAFVFPFRHEYAADKRFSKSNIFSNEQPSDASMGFISVPAMAEEAASFS
jgi:hypothetical protein